MSTAEMLSGSIKKKVYYDLLYDTGKENEPVFLAALDSVSGGLGAYNRRPFPGTKETPSLMGLYDALERDTADGYLISVKLEVIHYGGDERGNGINQEVLRFVLDFAQDSEVSAPVRFPASIDAMAGIVANPHCDQGTASAEGLNLSSGEIIEFLKEGLSVTP